MTTDATGKGNSPFEIHFSIPVLRMFDETEAKAFYLDYLGFEVDWENRFSPTAPLYMQVRLGQALLHLDGHATPETPASQVVIQVRGLEAFCEHLIAKRAPYPEPATEDVRFVGRKTDMNVDDPFGNLLIFCSERMEQ